MNAPPRPAGSALAAYVISLAAGAGGWVYLAHGRLSREGWDNPAYFSPFLPLLVALAFVLGIVQPTRPWRWPAIMFGAQALMASIGHPTASLLPLGLVLFAILSVPAMVAGYVGAFIRHVTTRRTAAGRQYR